MIRNMTGTLRNRHDGATQVRDTKPIGRAPQALTRPGHASRSSGGHHLSNAVEDLGGRVLIRARAPTP